MSEASAGINPMMQQDLARIMKLMAKRTFRVSMIGDGLVMTLIVRANEDQNAQAEIVHLTMILNPDEQEELALFLMTKRP